MDLLTRPQLFFVFQAQEQDEQPRQHHQLRQYYYYEPPIQQQHPEEFNNARDDDLIWLPYPKENKLSRKIHEQPPSSAEAAATSSIVWWPQQQQGPRRRKRGPTPNLASWLFQRRANRNPETLNQASPPGTHLSASGAEASEFDHQRAQELNAAIMKLKIWEAALLHRFGDRFRDSPENLAMNPIWMKVMKLRSMLHQLMQVAEVQRRGMDTTRMK